MLKLLALVLLILLIVLLPLIWLGLKNGGKVIQEHANDDGL